jgi:hypothetical protein
MSGTKPRPMPVTKPTSNPPTTRQGYPKPETQAAPPQGPKKPQK